MTQINAAERQILAYGLATESLEMKRLQELAGSKSIKVVEISQKDFSQKLGYLAGLPGFENSPDIFDGDPIEDSIIWFVSITRDDLSWILQQYSITKGLQPIKLKSVLTNYNVNWTLIEHYYELQREHKMMQAYTFVYHAKSAYKDLNPADYSKESLENLGNIISRADPDLEKIQKGLEVSQEVLDNHVKNIKIAYQALVPSLD